MFLKQGPTRILLIISLTLIIISCGNKAEKTNYDTKSQSYFFEKNLTESGDTKSEEIVYEDLSDEDLYQEAKNALYLNFNPVKSEKLVDMLLERDSNKKEYLFLKGQSLFYKDYINLEPTKINGYEKAKEIFTELTTKYPKIPEYKLYLANTHGKIGTFKKKKGETFFSYLGSLNKYQNLIKELNKDFPNYIEAVVARAEVYYEAPGGLGGDKEKAIKMYKKVLKSHPESMRAEYLLAKATETDDEKEMAKKYLEIKEKFDSGYYEKNPPNQALRRMAVIEKLARMYKEFDWEMAYKYIKEMIELVPTYSKGWYLIGLYYNELEKDDKKALEAFKKCLTLNPWNEGVKDRIERLEEKLE